MMPFMEDAICVVREVRVRLALANWLDRKTVGTVGKAFGEFVTWLTPGANCINVTAKCKNRPGKTMFARVEWAKWLKTRVLGTKSDGPMQAVDFSRVTNIFHDFSAFFTTLFSCKGLIFRRLEKIAFIKDANNSKLNVENAKLTSSGGPAPDKNCINSESDRTTKIQRHQELRTSNARGDWGLTVREAVASTRSVFSLFCPERSASGRRAAPAWLALAVLGVMLIAPGVRGQTAYTVKPTVTAETGDLGGKYFGQTPDPARTRHYYIAAERDQWDFMPLGADPVCGMTPSPEVTARHIANKARYFQYTDGTFTTRAPETPRLGIMGPVLRGVVGDYIEVTFWNRTALPLSMHPHGVKYDKNSEGSYYTDKSLKAPVDANGGRYSPGLGAAVGPNAKFTYVWYMDEKSGPLPTEPSSKGWLYHSHVSGEGEINMGLEGCIIVTDPKRARPDGTPNDVDREMPALFMIFNEGHGNPEAEEQEEAARKGQPSDSLLNSLALASGQKPAAAAAGATNNPVEDTERHTINGYIYGNLPGLEMNEGERVRWYLFGLGSESDLHTPHWHGLRVLEEGVRRTDTVELLPGSMKVADMVADDPGDWLFHCHVGDHMANGMFALVRVHPRDKPGVSTSPAKAFLGIPAPSPGGTNSN
jgi:FtsP/CotA-like multicopper oxidase with cupredoxin domain